MTQTCSGGTAIHPHLPKFGIIAIDGVDRSGKTCLACMLAKDTESNHIELDLFRWEGLGVEGYTSSIDYDALINCVSCCTTNTIVIEGIFVKDILISAGLPSFFHIFCSKQEISISGSRHTHEFDDDIVAEFPEALAYRKYLERHNLPTNADIIFRWDSKC